MVNEYEVSDIVEVVDGRTFCGGECSNGDTIIIPKTNSDVKLDNIAEDVTIVRESD